MVKTTLLVLLAISLLQTFSGPVQASVSAPTTMLTANNTAKPGCQSTCGNLTIPYPFGISEGCAMEWEYLIRCNEVEKGVFTPQFQYYNSTILEISENKISIAAMGPIAASCKPRGMGNDWGRLNLTGQPYALSSANKLIFVGCQNYGLIETTTGFGHQIISCVTLCKKKEDLFDRACAGSGCCQVPLPPGLQSFDTSLETITYNTSISSGDCSYSFVVKPSSFDYRGVAEIKSLEFLDKLINLSIVLDWFIRNNSCTYAKRNSSSFACKNNTVCVDASKAQNVKGYHCRCLNGYQGNPYLSPGCTDINECKSNPCAGECENTHGGYKCHCPHGNYGDGEKDGSGCRATRLNFIFILGLSIGLGFILFLLGGYWAYHTTIRRKEINLKSKNFKRNGGLLLQQQMSSGKPTEKIKLFTAAELEKATDQFNEDRVLGCGGQGTVYKGMLRDGNLVTIKKHEIGSQTQLGQFINEIAVMTEINHRNIVKLLGCCLETDVPLLVYEFIPNGTLSKCVHDPLEEFPITWGMRLHIALDVAGALTYLHSASSIPIFHKDIKSSNILLDAKYRAKLSDFGISRCIAIDQTHLTTRVQGTFGYIDPEFFQSNQYTEKSDVYSFGVVLVELLTGKKAVIHTESYNGRSLVSWFLSSMKESNVYDILSARVVNEATSETISAIANLAKHCLNIDGKQRPTMRQVSLELEATSHNQGAHVSFLKNSSLSKEQTTVERTSPSDEECSE